MAQGPYVRYWAAGGALLTAYAVLMAALLVPAATNSAASGSIPTSLAWEVGGGFVTVSSVQNITMTAYGEPFCPGPAPPSYGCTVPSGVTFVPADDTLVLTETATNVGGTVYGANEILGFDPGTMAPKWTLPLSCAPGEPYFPGSGTVVYVACWNATAPSAAALLEVDSTTHTVVANLSIPVFPVTMAFDLSPGRIYAGADGNALLTIDTARGGVVGVRNVTGASFTSNYPGTPQGLAFDPVSGDLIAASSSGGLIVFDPANGSPVANVSLTSPALTLALDPADARLYVGTSGTQSTTSAVEVFNTSGFHLLYQLSLPNPAEGIVFDPLHGDVYFIALGSVYALNLSSRLVVATANFFNGFPSGAAYLPTLDRLFLTPWIDPDGGSLVQLHHTTFDAATRLLWLPTSLGTLVVGSIAGAFVVGLVRRSSSRTNPASAPAVRKASPGPGRGSRQRGPGPP